MSEPFDDFMFEGGTYHSHLQKMLHHTVHVKLLGSRKCGQMCRDFVLNDSGAVLMEEDYAEKYQGTPNGEIQSEHFGKDASVSMEMRIVNFHGKNGSEKGRRHRTITYAVLSDEQAQNSSTTYQNLKLVLDDLISTRNEMELQDLKFLILMSDGCAVQYKCGAALYSLMVTAAKRGCIVFRCVKCPGHGKCRCDSEGGICKARVDLHFDRFVKVGKDEGATPTEPSVPIHRVEDGQLLSLAEVVKSVLDVDKFRFVAKSES